MFYQIATFPQHPGSSLAWIIGGVVAMAGTILLLKLSRSPQKIKGDRQQERARTTTRV